MEKWKEIPGYEDKYKISNLGNVYSKKYKRLLKIQINNGRYKCVSLSKDNKRKLHTLHRLIYMTFIGKIPKHLYVCHIDGNNKNNSIDNLKLGTPKENSQDMITHKTVLWGQKSPNAKLTEDDVKYIRKNPDKLSRNQMAKKFLVSKRTIQFVITRRNWAWLK